MEMIEKKEKCEGKINELQGLLNQKEILNKELSREL